MLKLTSTVRSAARPFRPGDFSAFGGGIAGDRRGNAEIQRQIDNKILLDREASVGTIGEGALFIRLDRVDVLQSSEDDQAVGNRRRRHHHLAYRVLRELFILRTRLDHVDVTVFARTIYLAVGAHW